MCITYVYKVRALIKKVGTVACIEFLTHAMNNGEILLIKSYALKVKFAQVVYLMLRLVRLKVN